MVHPLLNDSWNEGDSYELYVGRWSRLVAQKFLAWLNPPSSLRWLDVGCGTGALTLAIAESWRPAELIGIDPSGGFLAKARDRLKGIATFHEVNALNIPLPDSSMDVVVSGLALNFIPQPTAALAEMKRVARRGGTIAAYVWDYAGKMEFMRYFWDAAVELQPEARDCDEGVRFPICSPSALEGTFQSSGLADIQVAALEIDTRFRDFDDYWSPFLGGQGPAPSYVTALDEASRHRLRECIRLKLPIQPDGSIPFVARAWAVRGRLP